VAHRARLADVGFEGAPNEVLGELGARDELLQVHARLDPHLVKHVDEILGGHIPRGALCVRAAAQAPPTDPSKTVTPVWRPARTLARAAPRVSWKWRLSFSRGTRSATRDTRAYTCLGFAIPVVSEIPTSSAPLSTRDSAIRTTTPGSTSPS